MPSHLNRRYFLQAAAFGVSSVAAPSLGPGNQDRARVKSSRSASSASPARATTTWATSPRPAPTSSPCATWMKTAPARRASSFPQAKFYTDFRKLLDQKGLDAVVVATPDHTHAVATLAALKAGLHVYCEKPLTHTVHEARVVAETAAKQKRVTQMGTQIHAGEQLSPRRRADPERRHWPGHARSTSGAASRGAAATGRRTRRRSPRGCTGTCGWARPRSGPIIPTYVPFNWRRWWDFGGGTLADMACHYMDLPFWALELRHPTKVSAEGPPPHPETAADWLIVHYEFPARGELPPVKLTWYDGGKRPRAVRRGQAAASGATACCSSATRGCCWPTTASASCCRRRSSTASCRRSRPFPTRSAITRNGSRRARPAARRPATSTTAAR